MNKLAKNIVQWDQDVLNTTLNGSYFELQEELNFNSNNYANGNNLFNSNINRNDINLIVRKDNYIGSNDGKGGDDDSYDNESNDNKDRINFFAGLININTFIVDISENLISFRYNTI